ncbi:bifunctional riboflavin kinase/FAD synthetase [Mesoterricola sediminis]|uniref:Riboflavin biosynthesis protein n=1 Tax=Mesoterricola sediminis TaxID=2927980 RepID=A0AA48KDU9_9BACT|nr:bifunctional riboflavin kinase/FAD synthetase [Mesoterricola sediminis]BDU78739.1 riboflavin biosynthesis protein [Mesoterricola sediminis]
MKVWHHTLDAAPSDGPCVLTLGNFDGVHAAHRQVLALAAARARSLGIQAAVLTFDPHPSVIVAPERKPKRLMTLEQRLRIFEAAGMDLAWVMPFSRPFSELSPEAFLAGMDRALRPRELHVGRQFHFGRDRAGSIETLEAWGRQAGCDVHGHALRAYDGGHLSSTRIRAALDAGRVEEAAALLGHPYALTGIVVEGDRRGRHMGFPTANLAWEQEQLPAHGVYVTEVAGPHLPAPGLRGLTNVGEKPTFEGTHITVETHLPDFQGDLYGARLEVRFLHRIRGEMKFPDIEALRNQIERDVAAGRAWQPTPFSDLEGKP